MQRVQDPLLALGLSSGGNVGKGSANSAVQTGEGGSHLPSMGIVGILLMSDADKNKLLTSLTFCVYMYMWCAFVSMHMLTGVYAVCM